MQQNIIKGIRELLFEHDYLVLPGFGGFVLKSKPAHFNISGTTLLPPGKTVSFNVQLKQNDGLLATWLQKELNCSGSQAMDHIHEFSTFCSSILNTRRRLSMENLGFFYLDFENNICFEPQSDSNFQKDAFGLGALNLKEIPKQEKAVPVKENLFVDRPATAIQEPAVARRYSLPYRRLVAPLVLAFLLFGFLSLILSNRTVSGHLSAAFVSQKTSNIYRPFAYEPLKLEAFAPAQKTYVSDANGIAALRLNGKEIPVRISENISSENSGAYQIVVGCFSQQKNARRMVSKLRKQNVRALVSAKNEKGLYVVSIGSYQNHSEATEHLQTLREVLPKAWIKHH